jgi:hypothetical protein
VKDWHHSRKSDLSCTAEQEAVVVKHMRLIEDYAKKGAVRWGIDFDDALSYALEGAVLAAKRWDSERASFSTLLGASLPMAIRSGCRPDQKRMKSGVWRRFGSGEPNTEEVSNPVDFVEGREYTGTSGRFRMIGLNPEREDYLRRMMNGASYGVIGQFYGSGEHKIGRKVRQIRQILEECVCQENTG